MIFVSCGNILDKYFVCHSVRVNIFFSLGVIGIIHPDKVKS